MTKCLRTYSTCTPTVKAGSCPPPKGFTLSELLIALAILGLIATFTIPKVLQNVETQSNRAKFKEAIGVINDLLMQGINSGAITSTRADGTYFLNRLQTTKVCASNSQSQGCSPASQIGGQYEYDEPGVILHNGVMIVGLNNSSSSDNGFIIDANGSTGPNEAGKDQLYLNLCSDPNVCDPAATETPSSLGRVTYLWWSGAFTSGAYQNANKALYLSLWQ